VQVPEGLTNQPELLEWAEEQLRLSKPVIAWLDRHLA
jgi:hypothetical protein